MKKILLSFIIFSLTISASFSQTVIFDFETFETSVKLAYFGSSLNGQATDVVSNPNPTGVNTSSMVGQYIKPAGAETWAGGAGALPSLLDATAGGQICVNVHFDHMGNLAIKLEQEINGGENWITVKNNTTMNAWETICFDLADPSVEDSMLPANGVFPAITFFFDFGIESPGFDQTTFFDDVTFSGGIGPQPVELTLSVDMNEYTEMFTQAYVSGTFNNWSGDGNPLDDTDGDGIWTTTILDVPSGTHEYKFTLDNWAVQEDLAPTATCVKVFDDGNNVNINRFVTLNGNLNVAPVCFNSCYNCGAGVDLTFNVNMSNVTTSPDGVWLAGGGNFENPGGRFKMDDPDGDDIYSITMERESGFASFYTFANGNCPDYSCKENIVGQSCADPNNNDDRFLPALTGDVTVNTCFNECTTDTNCTGAPPVMRNITFGVGFNNSNLSFSKVYVSGTFNNWSGTANELIETEVGVYQVTLPVPEGMIEFKYTLDDWSQEEMFAGGESCTLTTGNFINRVYTVAADDGFCFDWNSCDECQSIGTNDVVVDNNLVQVVPNPIQDIAVLLLQESSTDKLITVYDAIGRQVYQTNISGFDSQLDINTTALSKGIYFIHVQTENTIATQRMVKQ